MRRKQSLINETYDCVQCPKCDSSQFLIYDHHEEYITLLCHWCVHEIHVMKTTFTNNKKYKDYSVLQCNKCNTYKFSMSKVIGSAIVTCARGHETRVIPRTSDDVPELQGSD